MEKIAKLFLADLGVVYLSKYERSGKQPFCAASLPSSYGRTPSACPPPTAGHGRRGRDGVEAGQEIVVKQEQQK